MQKALAFCIESWATMTESGKNPRRLRNMVDLPMRATPIEDEYGTTGGERELAVELTHHPGARHKDLAVAFHRVPGTEDQGSRGPFQLVTDRGVPVVCPRRPLLRRGPKLACQRLGEAADPVPNVLRFSHPAGPPRAHAGRDNPARRGSAAGRRSHRPCPAAWRYCAESLRHPPANRRRPCPRGSSAVLRAVNRALALRATIRWAG